tara:strand:+ start:2031 stop:2498 length:468 start_codon:yes stop_codon:yes gene_type:complete
VIFIGMDIIGLISKLLGRIKLTKPTLFGLDSNDIVLIVSPSLKIYGVDSRPKKLLDTFPFQKDRLLNSKELIKWAKENGYKITFQTDIPAIRRKLYSSFGDVMVESVNDGERELTILVMGELDKSSLPNTVKKWAKDNPEKFISNIRTIQEMLKK